MDIMNFNTVITDVQPACQRQTELFYGPDGDGRKDDEREDREAKAKACCTICPYRWRCLERTSLIEYRHAANGVFGVAGGMGEGERKRFYEHMRDEGYETLPEGPELLASVVSFYRSDISRKLKVAV